MSLKSSCSSLRTPHLPMPDKDALYRSFNQLLGSLDLPDDKVEEMNSYGDQKKWEILCSRSLMKVHQSPSFYLCGLRSLVGAKTTQSKTDARGLLRGLEVSLRTYSIDWLRNFLEERRALDTLADLVEANLSSESFHILVQCLKVIVADSMGFEAAINHPKLFDALVGHLPAVSMKNRCDILQLIAMAARKSSMGHERILKSLKTSDDGFEQLMDFLKPSERCEQQMVTLATLNLIKVVINLPSDFNYRTYLQFGFREIGFDDCIARLRQNESSLMTEVVEEIKSIESLIIDVNQLVKDRAEIIALAERLQKTEAKLMDMERQSINCEGDSEVSKKDGPAEMSSGSTKVDKVPETDASLKSTVKMAPTTKSECKPPPPPPPPVLMAIRKKTQPRCKLPSLNWQPLRPNQVRETVFNGLNDERLLKIINFTHFEDKFGLIDMSQSPRKSPLTSKNSTFVTLLEPTRLRNVSIVLRKLNFDADVAIEAINDYDFNQLNLDGIELLTNLAPKDSETEAYRGYMAQKKDISVLSEGDKFLLELSRVERLTTKLAVMDFMGNFDDRIDSLTIQLCAITSASLSLKSSKKFKSVLEIILTFGNYMNSNKSSGSAYGFRLQGTLEKLSDARSNDKTSTLIEYIVTETIAKQFPQLLTLDGELLCINEASRISIKSLSSVVADIKSGWNRLNDESKLSKSVAVKTFASSSNEKFNKLTNELKAAENNYIECMRYFGEDNAATDSIQFFQVIRKFVCDFKAFSSKIDF